MQLLLDTEMSLLCVSRILAKQKLKKSRVSKDWIKNANRLKLVGIISKEICPSATQEKIT